MRQTGQLLPNGAPGATGSKAPIPDFVIGVTLPTDSLLGASNFELPTQLHDPVRWNAEELGRIQGEVAQENEQPIPPSQKNE